MKFGSWTYDGLSVDLKPIRGYINDSVDIKIGMDLSEYYSSIEWDILEVIMLWSLVLPCTDRSFITPSCSNKIDQKISAAEMLNVLVFLERTYG